MTGASRTSEDEIHGPDHAQPCPEKVELDGGFHVEDGKRNEYQQRNDFLHYFELRQAQHCKANAIGRYLQQILEQGDTPTDQCSNDPGLFTKITQVGIPCEGHEYIGENEKAGSLKDSIDHIETPIMACACLPLHSTSKYS